MNTIKNSVRLIGNLGADPKIIKTDKGNLIVNASIATTDYYYDQRDERVEETQWHNLVFFGKQAEIAEKLLKKGVELAIEGKLTHSSYQKDGETKYYTQVQVNSFNVFTKELAV